jgi:hypothetical protein
MTNVRKTIAILAGIALTAWTAAAGGQALPQGFTCCNFHYEGDWISDANWGKLPFIPAGAPIKITDYGRYRAYAEIDGKKMRIGQDYGREQEKLDAFTQKLVVAEDPKAKIAAFPKNVQEAIRLGKVAVGMTREQVIISLGFPMTSETPSLDSPVWRYWLDSFDEFQVMWGADGRVKEIVGSPTVLTRAVLGKPN